MNLTAGIPGAVIAALEIKNYLVPGIHETMNDLALGTGYYTVLWLLGVSFFVLVVSVLESCLMTEIFDTSFEGLFLTGRGFRG